MNMKIARRAERIEPFYVMEVAKAASQLHHTRTGTIKGKFAYLAPEQIKGEGIDHRVDVFALGIVLHELLTLRPLFRGANDGETLQRVLSMDVPAPERVRNAAPTPVNTPHPTSAAWSSGNSGSIFTSEFSCNSIFSA